VSVRNAGNYWASKVRVEVYADDVLVGKTFVNFLNASESKTVSFSTYFQASPNKIKVVLDGKNKVPESVETNNVVEINLAYPDLVIENASASPSSPIEGDNVTITAQLKNSGNAAVSDVVVYLIVDGIKVSEVKESLAIGETKTVTFYWIAVYGTHNISVYADPGNTVGELNEANNGAEFQITVTQPVSETSLLTLVVLGIAVCVLRKPKDK
ncbi:MAG: CARDB domain-containing protein, partial [Thermoplasmata archaeon]